MKFYDDDMDELFNKAGRDYPLKTEPKNWDAVRAALHPEDGTVETTQKRNGWKRLLPLLFLLVIPAVYMLVDKDNVVGNSQQDVKPNEPLVTKEQPVVTNPKSERTISANDQRTVTVNDKRTIQPVDDNAALITDKANADRVINRTGSNKENDLVKAKANDLKALDKLNDRTNNNSEREVTRLSYVPPSKQTLKNVTKVEEGLVSEKGGLSGPPQAGDLQAWNNFPTLSSGFNSLNGPSEVISLKTPMRSLNQSSTLGSVPNSDKKPKADNNRKGPYLGLITAPDVSTIKGQTVKGIGYSAGAIVGYTLNNRWQVEAGMLWSRKKYFTDGKYFDKKGAGIPDNVRVLWLNGGCEMFEFPIVARYNISQKKNTFFVSAGLASYLMKKEDYNYSAIAGAGTYPYEGYREYDRSGDHLFSNLQLSAGYNLTLSSKLNLRIEPYLKAPLKKIGIGKMPITSTGLYFAITRDFR